MKTNNQHLSESASSSHDEGWWAALLAEEHAWAAETPLAQSEKPKPSAGVDERVDWDRVVACYENDEIVDARVSGFNQGGLLVENDSLHGFVPVSHLVDLNLEPTPAGGKAAADALEMLKGILSDYVGSNLRLKVIECDPARGRIVLSERAALAAPGRRNQLLDRLQGGEQVTGTVTNITDFGVFVDLGGLEGLIHISELSWGRVRHPSDVLRLSEKVQVHVIHADRDRCRVALSLKRLYPNPWLTAEQRYTVGQVVSVRVTSVVSFGAFARVEEGLDGLIHNSEMTKPDQTGVNRLLVREGQQVQARVVHIDAARQRLGLSLVIEE